MKGTCSKCLQPNKEFTLSSPSRCTDCVREYNEVYRISHPKVRTDRDRKNDVRYNSSEAGKEAQSRYRHSEKGLRRTASYNQVRYYGITLDEKEKQLAKQGNRCANPGCRTSDPGTTRSKIASNAWHSDHDHETGKRRGILCHGCNLALGNIQDDVKKLRGLILYLESYNE